MRQLTHGLDPEQKLQILLERLSRVDDQWNDLDLGGPSFFGFGQDCWLHCDSDLVQYWPFDPIVAETIQAGKRFFFVAHHLLFLQTFIKLWPSMSVIVLDNPDQFCSRYRPQYLARRTFERQRLEQLWQQVPELQAVAVPDTMEQWQNMSPGLSDRIRDQHPSIWTTWQRWQYETLSGQNRLQRYRDGLACEVQGWDIDWYLDQDTMLERLQSLYHWLNLGGFDKDIILCYHTHWLQKLGSMSHQVQHMASEPSDRWRTQPYRPSI